MMRIPKMDCDPGCGECCGIVLCNSAELHRMRDWLELHELCGTRNGRTCPLYQHGRCIAYIVRPLSCRLFGHVPEMRCPRGYNKNISRGRAARMMQSQYPNPEDFEFVHSLVYETEEIEALIRSEFNLPEYAEVQPGFKSFVGSSPAAQRT